MSGDAAGGGDAGGSQADVFVRAVTPEGGHKLAQIARRSKQPIRMRRAVEVMASAQHQPVGFIAKLMQVSESACGRVFGER
ncbi:hypothetical protein [Nocardia sp. NPDC004860]|uniref:hypothetical protein n=1 Tax=Nocardia sp. NPDC004860 TaxID=3154557 RepID=UPI0033A237D4